MKKKAIGIGAAGGVLIAAVLIYLLILMPTNYVVYQPGSAEDVAPMIHMEDGYAGKAGSFMLTTVSQITKVNWATYYYQVWFNTYAQILDKKQIFREGENRTEYFERQNYNMISSQNRAVLAAYNLAQVDYVLKTDHIIVIGVIDTMPAANSLVAGDRIVSIDGTELADAEMLSSMIQQKQIGDTVKIGYQRDGEWHDAAIPLANIASAGEAERPGIGITMGSVLSVHPDDPGKAVEFSVSNIGGPSAGFMFAMEIYNRLMSEDITKGWRIAGTGEIYPDGEVGSIGGITHKVVAADREHADFFFCPMVNVADALKEAEKIQSDMKIIGVNTMQEAIRHLQEQPAASSSLTAGSVHRAGPAYRTASHGRLGLFFL